MAALQTLGLKHQVMQQANQFSSIEYAKANGKTLSTANLDNAPLDEQPFVAMKSLALLDILKDGVENIRFNCSPTKVEYVQEGTLVEFSDGYSQFFDLIVGADGIHSKIRELLFSANPVQNLAVSCWRFLAYLPDVAQSPRYLVGNDDAFAFYPLGKGYFYCYAESGDKNKQLLSASPEQLAKHFQHYETSVARAFEQIGNANPLFASAVETITPKEFFNSNVALIGDALHGCPPSLQQGVGLAIEDALVLARLLSRYPYEQAFPRYEQIRRQRVTWVGEQSTRSLKLASKGRFFHGRVARNNTLRRKGPGNVAFWQKLMAQDPLKDVL
ncbi:FAD-dependent monooxygenase [Corallincola platygyrae]